MQNQRTQFRALRWRIMVLFKANPKPRTAYALWKELQGFFPEFNRKTCYTQVREAVRGLHEEEQLKYITAESSVTKKIKYLYRATPEGLARAGAHAGRLGILLPPYPMPPDDLVALAWSVHAFLGDRGAILFLEQRLSQLAEPEALPDGFWHRAMARARNDALGAERDCAERLLDELSADD